MVSPAVRYVCGRSTMVLQLSRALHSRRIRVTLLTDAGSDGGLLAEQPFPVEYVPIDPTAKRLADTVRFGKALRRLSPDIVHTHHRYPAFLMRFASGMNAGHITTVHSFIEGKHRIGIRADRWVAVSDAVNSWLQEKYGIDARRITTIRNGIEAGEPVGRKQKNGTAFTVFAAGRFSREKGMDILLEAWKDVPRSVEGLPVRLVIAGDGEEKPALESLANKCGGTVELVNGVGIMERLYAAADLVVIPSREESLSYVLLEAGIRNIPVVCADTGGMKELVAHGRTGTLFPPGNVAALTNAISGAVRNYRVSQEYAEQLYTELIRNNTVETMTDAYIRIYNSIDETRRQ